MRDAMEVEDNIDYENKIESFVEAEITYIESSKILYRKLLEEQNNIKVGENSVVVIYDDEIKNNISKLIAISDKDYEIYIDRSDELFKMVQKRINENLETIKDDE